MWPWLDYLSLTHDWPQLLLDHNHHSWVACLCCIANFDTLLQYTKNKSILRWFGSVPRRQTSQSLEVSVGFAGLTSFKLFIFALKCGDFSILKAICSLRSSTSCTSSTQNIRHRVFIVHRRSEMLPAFCYMKIYFQSWVVGMFQFQILNGKGTTSKPTAGWPAVPFIRLRVVVIV